MTTDLRKKWDARYRDAEGPGRVAAVLADNLHLLPRAGAALDLACGLGGNALLLAEQGLRTEAWDLSAVAIERLRAEARRRELPLNAQVRDVVAEPPVAGEFDVIVVAHFLERDLAPALIAALKPGGLLFYQTFTRAGADGRGPPDPGYRLASNELLHLFAPLTLVAYREEGELGAPGPLPGEAMLIGRQSEKVLTAEGAGHTK